MALISALGDDADALASLPLIVAMGEEVGAAAAALAPDAEVLQLGARLSPEKVVECWSLTLEQASFSSNWDLRFSFFERSYRQCGRFKFCSQ